MFFFFFKQKTAYEMRISDWSSDVCYSDLRRDLEGEPGGQEDDADDEPDRRGGAGGELRGQPDEGGGAGEAVDHRDAVEQHARGQRAEDEVLEARQIGRASCRERVCQYV